MKKSKFTESQIIGILKEQEQGKKVSDLCREYYGVLNFDFISSLTVIKETVGQIDLRQKTEIKLLDKQDNLVQSIRCDKFSFVMKVREQEK